MTQRPSSASLILRRSVVILSLSLGHGGLTLKASLISLSSADDGCLLSVSDGDGCPWCSPDAMTRGPLSLCAVQTMGHVEFLLGSDLKVGVPPL